MGEGVRELWLLMSPGPVRIGNIEVLDAGHYGVTPALEALPALADAKESIAPLHWELRDGVVRIGFSAFVHELHLPAPGKKPRAVLRVF
jgi:hypothetical protein